MKKSFVVLFFLLFGFLVKAQNGCTPDPQFVLPGVYPDSATGLSNAYVGQNYSENITMVVPQDSTVIILGNMEIIDIELVSVTGLPSSFSYTCDPPSCIFDGGTIACAELFSTIPPDASMIGLYPIEFSTLTTVISADPITAALTGEIEQTDVIDYYFIEINSATSVISKLDNNTFKLNNVFPNPVNDKAKIQFVSGENQDIIFKIYNLLGEEIDSKIIPAKRGVNDFYLNTSSYSEGIYLYSINNGIQVLIDRMVVSN